MAQARSHLCRACRAPFGLVEGGAQLFVERRQAAAARVFVDGFVRKVMALSFWLVG